MKVFKINRIVRRVPILLMNLFSVLSLSFFISSCGVQQEVAVEMKEVCVRNIQIFNDSSGALSNRFVFSKIPCSAVQYKNKNGRNLLRINSRDRKDSVCFTCDDEFSKKDRLSYPIGNEISYDIYMDGHLLIINKGCTKGPYSFFRKFSDTTSVVVWHYIDTIKKQLTFYAAEERVEYPYYNALNLDSFQFDLTKLCLKEELDDNRIFNQSLINKYMKVDITPNPFKETFELKITMEKLSDLANEEKTISFYDDKGNLLKSQVIALDAPYSFSFPEIQSGKIIYYTVNWADYQVGGQIAKS